MSIAMKGSCIAGHPYDDPKGAGNGHAMKQVWDAISSTFTEILIAAQQHMTFLIYLSLSSASAFI